MDPIFIARLIAFIPRATGDIRSIIGPGPMAQVGFTTRLLSLFSALQHLNIQPLVVIIRCLLDLKSTGMVVKRTHMAYRDSIPCIGHTGMNCVMAITTRVEF